MEIKDVYIISACRTGIGSFNGQYSQISATNLGSTVIKQCIERAGVTADDVSEVIMGQVLTAGQGQNPGRLAARIAGIPAEAPSYTINLLCGSGLKAVALGYQSIKSGDSDIVICGGQENMTMSHHSACIRNGIKYGNLELKDTLLADGLVDTLLGVHMGVTAEFVAQKYKVTREAQDNFALQSQLKASTAIRENYFRKEIVPVQQIKPPKSIVDDQFVKPETTIEKLGKLNTSFEKDLSKSPSVTAGNASGVNDGAAAVMLCSDVQLKLKKLKPLAKIIAFAQTGIEPMEMGLGPVKAVQKVLQKSGWTKEDVDLYELNEAFASQSLVVIEQLGLDREKVNITGGAIALGHPIGASGARVLVTLIYNLERKQLKRGVAALCIGGGMGIAVSIEKL